MKILQCAFIAFTLLLLSCSSDDPGVTPVRVSILDLSMDEGNVDSNASIRIQLSAASDEKITVFISSNDVSAESNTDYIPFQNVPVVFQAGDTEKDHQIVIKGDLATEEDEYFEVTIASVEGPVTINDGTARVDLLNDDMGPQLIPVTITIDFDGLVNLPANSEASAYVNFGQPGGMSNADYTTETNLGDEVGWELESNAAPEDVILFNGIEFQTADTIWGKYLELVTPMSVDSLPYPEYKIQVTDADQGVDREWKFNLWFYAERNGVRSGPYYVDPKIKIQGR